MYTSVTEKNKRKAQKDAAVFLGVSILTGLFGAIYELFSHEVYSYFMIYAFAFPLLLGTLPYLMLSLSGGTRYPNALCRNLYHAGIATLTTGSIMRGVLDIYGTTNSLSNIYWFAGIPMTVLPVFIFCFQRKKLRAVKNENAAA